MRPKVLKPALQALAIIGLGSSLLACSSASTSYPSVAEVDRITKKLLTPEERKKAIDDMALENTELRAKTIESIEKR